MMTNFLQSHYNEYRNAGGDHDLYVVWNDISEELGDRLRQNFEDTHPPVSEEKKGEFMKNLEKEAATLRLSDDLDWLLGTGRFSQ